MTFYYQQSLLNLKVNFHYHPPTPSQSIAECPDVEYKDGFLRKRDDWPDFLASETSFGEGEGGSPGRPSKYRSLYLTIHFLYQASLNQ